MYCLFWLVRDMMHGSCYDRKLKTIQMSEGPYGPYDGGVGVDIDVWLAGCISQSRMWGFGTQFT